jgi:biotin carboxylase
MKMQNTKQKIVIVECYSSSVNYIHDIRERGYEPVLLECYSPKEELEEVRKINDKAYAFNGDPCPPIIMANKQYEETLKHIRELSPLLILPGSDPGLELSLRLSSDLGLKNNPLSILWNLRDKFVTQEVLKSAGIRHIKSRIVSTEEEAVDFYKEEQGKKVVIKPTQAAASKSVFICGSEYEVRKAYRITDKFVKKRNNKAEKIIIQQYIDGEEYVVDTVSCEGKHVALFGMKYKKRICEGFGKIYDTDFYLSTDDADVKELVDYCFQVLSCLGVKYGAVHSEFMVDDKGPVLIETNARSAGAFQKYTFQDKVMENHETAVSLDSYLMNPKQFFDRYPERMHLKQPAVVKQLCLEEPIFVEKVKITERLSSLESFDYAIENGENCVYPKTTDLDSNGGIIYLTASDCKIIENDLKEIIALEKSLDELFDWHRT